MILDDFRLDGKIALVTGASRGIGQAIAIAFAEVGADVVVVSRREAALEQTADAVRKSGRRALVVPANCGKRDDIAALGKRVRDEWGHVDILVNNAATNPVMGPLTTVDEAAWDKTFDVNLKGPYLLVKEFVEGMKERRSGKIVNVASNGAFRPVAVLSTYCITKAALVTMTKVLSQELGPYGINVNAIAPGLVETQMSSALMANPDALAQTLETFSLRRYGQPHEIAGLAVYLASTASAFVTGETYVIDGGMV